MKMNTVLSNELRKAIAAASGRAEDDIVMPDPSVLNPISVEIAKERRKIYRKEELYPGRFIEGQGVYLGEYAAKDRKGKTVGKVFDVFAAPEDLTTVTGKRETFDYIHAVDAVAALKEWHGYDGTPYKNDEEIYTALKDGSYNGGWIIPPREILIGSDLNGVHNIEQRNLFRVKNSGAFAGTFSNVDKRKGVEAEGWYWSSTQHPKDPQLSWYSRFSDTAGAWNSQSNYKMSCRLVRLVECRRSRATSS